MVDKHLFADIPDSRAFTVVTYRHETENGPKAIFAYPIPVEGDFRERTREILASAINRGNPPGGYKPDKAAVYDAAIIIYRCHFNGMKVVETPVAEPDDAKGHQDASP